MGYYGAMAKRIREESNRRREAERLWRTQETKVLKILNFCRVIKSDDDGVFAAALDKVCTRLEKELDLQSPLIMQALKDVIVESDLPSLHGRAAICYSNTDWRVAKLDAAQREVYLASCDSDVINENQDADRQTLADIDFKEPQLRDQGDAVREAVTRSLVQHSHKPVAAQRLRDIFAKAAADDTRSETMRNEAQVAFQDIVSLQNQEITATADALLASKIFVRPRLFPMNGARL